MGFHHMFGVFICPILLVACTNVGLQRAGSVSPVNFEQTIDITTQKSVVIVPVQIEGKTRQFLFDTGAQLTLLQKQTTEGYTTDVTGASERSMQLGNEFIPALKIGEQTFNNTHAWNGDFVGLKEQITNFGGILGQSVINKTNWLIDGLQKTLTMSSAAIAVDGFTEIDVVRKEGIPYTFIEVEGHTYEVEIDSGSSATFSVPPEHPLAGILLRKYKFDTRNREIYTLGGLQNISEKVAVIESVKLGSLEFNQVLTDIRPSSHLRLGMAFFGNVEVYIDNINGDYKIRK